MGTLRSFPVLLAFVVSALFPVQGGSFPNGAYVLYSRTGIPEGTIGVVNVDTGLDYTIMPGAWPVLAANAPLLLYHTGNPTFSRANINLRNITTEADKRLLTGSDFIVGVDWTVDDQNVIFDYSCDIEFIKSDGTARRGFISGDCYDDAPAVNPVDGRIVFHNANSGLYLADADGQHRRFMRGTRRGDVWPVWSPAEDQIAFWAGSSLMIQNIDGSGRTDLTAQAKLSANLAEGRPAWTPDGQWVVAATTINGTNGLWAFAIDGSSIVVRIPTVPGEALTWVGNVLTAQQVADWSTVSISTGVNFPSVVSDEIATMTISVTNRGPGVARGLRLTNEIPSDVTVISSAVSAGVLSTEGGVIVAQLDELKSGASFTETLQLRSSIGGAHPITLTAVATNRGAAAVVATGGGQFFVGPQQPHYREGVIYGRHNADGDGIWYAPSDGGAELKITDGGRPRLSPDGTGLAFVRGNVVGSHANLWWRDLGTGEEKQVFAVGDFLVGLTWSSNSQWIIFDYSCGIYARTRTGGDPGLTIDGSCYFDGPSVQASDGRIVFHSSVGLYLGNAVYRNIHNIPDTHAGDYWPVWSPDGGWIVYVNAADLWMIRPDGTGRTRLTKIGANGEGFSNPAAWTPRGRQIVAAGKVAGKSGLFTIVPSGQDAPVLLRDLPSDSEVTDVGAVVGTLLDGIELQANLQLLPSGAPRQVLVSGPPQVPYAIEATTDFANWVRVYTNPPATTDAYHEDFNAFRYRFYRGIPLTH